MSHRRNCFLSCDWGTSRFRLRLVERSTLSVLGGIESPEGASRLAGANSPEARARAFEHYLTSRASELLSEHGADVEDCMVSGMATSRMGWQELPYAGTPVPLDGSGLVHRMASVHPKSHRPLRVHLISGVCSEENVMRGEETELIGLAMLHPEITRGRALLIFPGTHSKHIHISDGVLRSFDTFMTGELFSHLHDLKTLRDSLDPQHRVKPGSEAFLSGVRRGASAGLFKSLFGIRARRLLQNIPQSDGSDFLSGMLIASELVGIGPAADVPVIVAATRPLDQLYHDAATALGLRNFQVLDPDSVERAVGVGHLRILENSENRMQVSAATYPDARRSQVAE